MATAWPSVRAALVDLLTAALPDATVYDGPNLSGDSPSAYVCVGWQPSTDDESAGSYDQSRTGPEGFANEEVGKVLLEFGAVTGDPSVPSAFALVEGLQAAVQADQSLGVLTGAPTVSLAVEVIEAQNQAGAVQRLLVTLSYTTRVA